MQTTTAGMRWRLVTSQRRLDGAGFETHVSSVALGTSEVADHLEAERKLHTMTGWTVTPCETNALTFICERDTHYRAITAVCFTPFDDPGSQA